MATVTPPRRVLLVDDDQDIVFGASVRLRAAGYRTFIAHDGQEGVDAAIEQHPDAILLDVLMPRMDGLTALDMLRHREDTKDIPIVMLSASLVDQQAALEAGARFFLTKPYQGQTLLAAIASAIDANRVPATQPETGPHVRFPQPGPGPSESRTDHA